jgi:hypothetical protein
MMTEWRLPLPLAVIDTMSAAAGFKDESSSAEVQAVMNVLAALANKLKCLVVGIDHFGKMIEVGTRGSSAKEASADVVLALLGDRDQSGTIANLRMAVRKLRAGSVGAETSFTLRVVQVGEDRDREPITTCVVEWNSAPTATPKPAKNGWTKSLSPLRKALMAVLLETSRDERPFGGDGPMVKAADLEIVRTEFYRSYPADGATKEMKDASKRKAFNRGLNGAIEKNLDATREVDGVTLIWLTAG